MIEKSACNLPVTVTNPDSVRTGELFLADLSSMGMWGADIQTVLRAVCTLGEQYREFDLTGFVVTDRHSAVFEYDDESCYQIEFLIDDLPVTETSIRKLEDYLQEEDWNLVVVTDGKITRGARQYSNSNPSVDVIELEPQCCDSAGMW